VLCQFTDRTGVSEHGRPRRTLAEFIKIADVYPAGRLDYDSEGLLLLTDDGLWPDALTDPRQRTAKTYCVQVEGDPGEEALRALRKGVLLNDGPTLPAQVRHLPRHGLAVAARSRRVRFPARAVPGRLDRTATPRKDAIRQGYGAMTAAVGLPTLSLIRTRIGDVALDGLHLVNARVNNRLSRCGSDASSNRSHERSSRSERTGRRNRFGAIRPLARSARTEKKIVDRR
jgi:23S rRNA pseudouridine2457 synthase